MINTDKFILSRIILEFRYNKGWLYLDRTGLILNQLLDQYPELEKNITISNIDAGVLIKSNNPRVTLAFTSNHISTDIEYPSEKSNDIKNYTEFSDNALNIITETLEISSFTRVGNRLIYHYRTDTLDEVNDIFTHYKFFQTSDSITNTFGESLTEPEIKFIASYDKDIQQTIRIGTVSRSYDKLSLPKSIDAKLIVEKGMSFDIDYFTNKIVDVSHMNYAEFIKTNIRSSNKNISKLFT